MEVSIINDYFIIRKTLTLWTNLLKITFFYGSFRGAGPGCNTEELGEKLTQLKKEIARLEDYEQTLDRHKAWIQQSITNITDDIDSRQYLYVTEQDLYEMLGENQIIPIKAPMGTELEILGPVKDRSFSICVCVLPTFYFISGCFTFK